MNGAGRTELRGSSFTASLTRWRTRVRCVVCSWCSSMCHFPLSLAPPGRWSVRHTARSAAFWFSAHAVTKPFPFSPASVRRPIRLADFVFSSVSPTGHGSVRRWGPSRRPSSLTRPRSSLKLPGCAPLTFSHTRGRGIFSARSHMPPREGHVLPQGVDAPKNKGKPHTASLSPRTGRAHSPRPSVWKSAAGEPRNHDSSRPSASPRLSSRFFKGKCLYVTLNDFPLITRQGAQDSSPTCKSACESTLGLTAQRGPKPVPSKASQRQPARLFLPSQREKPPERGQTGTPPRL